MGRRAALRIVAFVAMVGVAPVVAIPRTPSYAERAAVVRRPAPMLAVSHRGAPTAQVPLVVAPPVPSAPPAVAAPAVVIAPAAIAADVVATETTRPPDAVVAPPSGADPGLTDLRARVAAAFAVSVPAVWRASIPVQLRLIAGHTSWAHPDNLMQVATYHAGGRWNHLVSVLAHEFGHLIAYRDGSLLFDGDAPAGWPYEGAQPAEAWADCVSEVFTGIVDPSHGLGPCPATSRSWAAAWLAAGR